ncbi:MAG: hypothetical protein KAT70_09755 [Thermoplasmata archaeon]|nr:hypothetical protein [Thermoplasmata archaeon]
MWRGGVESFIYPLGVLSCMEHWLVFLVGLMVMVIILFAAVRIFTGEDFFEFSYLFRLILAALIIIVVAPFFQSITPDVLGPVSTMLAFVIILYAVRSILVEPIISRESWEKSIWISLLAVSVVYVLNALFIEVFDKAIVPSPF